MKEKFNFLLKYFNPPGYFILLLFLSLVSHVICPFKIIYPPLSYIGAILVIIGIAINSWADFLIMKIGGSKKIRIHGGESAMITSGPYKYSRNPMYLGFFLILFGLAVFLGSIITFVFPITFWLSMEFLYIPIEENKLEEEFEEEYKEYKQKTRRWI